MNCTKSIGRSVRMGIAAVLAAVSVVVVSADSASAAPGNDMFSSAIPLSGTSTSTTGSNVGATMEPGEPDHAGVSVGDSYARSVWYRYTPSASGTLDVTTDGSDYDTTLAVYVGSAVNALIEVGSNDDNGGFQSRVIAPVNAGVVYQIAVAGFSGAEGNITLRVDLTPAGPPLPVGDGAGATSAWQDHLDVFVRGQDDAMYTRHFNGSAWTGWISLGGIITGTPAAASRGTGLMDIFVRGQDNAMWTRHFNGTSWGGWSSLGGIITAPPAVVSRSPNTLDVFVRGQDSALYTRHFNGTSWGGWISLGGIVTTTAAAASPLTDVIDVFVRGQDAALWTRRFGGGVWGDWVTLGGIVTTAPGAVARYPGFDGVDVFVRGQDNAVWSLYIDLQTAGPWRTLGGAITSPVAAASRLFGLVDLFVRGQDSALWTMDMEDFSLGRWTSLGGVIR